MTILWQNVGLDISEFPKSWFLLSAFRFAKKNKVSLFIVKQNFSEKTGFPDTVLQVTVSGIFDKLRFGNKKNMWTFNINPSV